MPRKKFSDSKPNSRPSILKPIAAGGAHVLIVLEDRTVASFGLNRSGALGLGHTRNTLSRHTVPELPPARAVDAGYEFSVALSDAGEVWSWGQSEYGQCGRGSFGVFDYPARLQVPAMDSIACGGWHCLMREAATGSLYGCGCSAGGRLALEDAAPVTKPVKLPFDRVSCFSAGDFHSLVSLEDGSLFECGRSTPLQDISRHVDGDVMSLSAARDHSMLLTTDHRLYTWGVNGVGQLGLGDHVSRSVPTEIPLPAALREDPPVLIRSAYYVSMAISKSGVLWAWGSNDYGELGLSRFQCFSQDQPVPVALPCEGAVSDVAICGCGGVLGACVLAITTDGHLYSWGSSRHNQCGLNRVLHVDMPTEVPLSVPPALK